MNTYSELDPLYHNYHFRHYDSSLVANSSASSSIPFASNQRRQMTRPKKRPSSLYYGSPNQPFYRQPSSPTGISSSILNSSASQRSSYDRRSSHPLSLSSSLASSSSGASSSSSSSVSYFTWLVFLNEKWVPFDPQNQTKLEQTLSSGGTFVDVSDSHFPNVKRVRVFPRSNYLSYLGVKYRLSRIMQPDAWLDHINLEREHRSSNKSNDGFDSVASSQKMD